MTVTQFVYVIYIAATPEKVWQALTDGEVTKQYWDARNVSDWKVGSKWEHTRTDDNGKVVAYLRGTVLEVDPPRRLAVTWGEGEKGKASRVTFEIERISDIGAVRLAVTHDGLDSEMLAKITQGWPMVLSSLKSFLETGKALPAWREASSA